MEEEILLSPPAALTTCASRQLWGVSLLLPATIESHVACQRAAYWWFVNAIWLGIGRRQNFVFCVLNKRQWAVANCVHAMLFVCCVERRAWGEEEERSSVCLFCTHFRQTERAREREEEREGEWEFDLESKGGGLQFWGSRFVTS